MGRFRMFLGTIYALRRTLGLQRSLLDMAFAEDESFARKSSQAPHSPKDGIVGFMNIGIYGMGGCRPPTHPCYGDISITAEISDIRPKLVNKTTLTWMRSQRPTQLFINIIEPVYFTN